MEIVTDNLHNLNVTLIAAPFFSCRKPYCFLTILLYIILYINNSRILKKFSARYEVVRFLCGFVRFRALSAIFCEKQNRPGNRLTCYFSGAPSRNRTYNLRIRSECIYAI